MLNGQGKGPKIVQHITEGSVSLYKKLDQDHDYYRPNPPKTSFDFINPFDPLQSNQFSVNQDLAMINSAGAFVMLYALALRAEKIWFYGKADADIVDYLPKKRDKVMQLFNDCPSAMVKFRDVKDKDFDFVYFLNYYNVECAGS